MQKIVVGLKKWGKTRTRYAENNGAPQKRGVNEDETKKARILRSIVGRNVNKILIIVMNYVNLSFNF